MDINNEAKSWAENNIGKSLEEAFIAGFIRHGEFAEKVRASKEEKLEKQKKDFYNELIPFVEKYGKENVRDFYNWFCQPNQTRTNINRYLQKTWDTNLRLAQWVSRNDKNGKIARVESKKDEPTKKYREI